MAAKGTVTLTITYKLEAPTVRQLDSLASQLRKRAGYIVHSIQNEPNAERTDYVSTSWIKEYTTSMRKVVEE
jgi:hypothetical protein